jgi:hypothetical protein
LKRNLIFYRGPLERSRLSLIIESVQQEGVSLHFMWIFPGTLTQKKKEHAEEFLKQYNFEQIEFRGETAIKILQTNLAFRRWMSQYQFSKVYLIGFSAPLFAVYKGLSKRIWFINGIPEEKGGGLLTSLMARILWKLQGWASKASLVVTVSSRMSNYVERRTGITNLFHAPTCTDLDIFRPKKEKQRKYFTYLGSGATWQALDWLEAVWYEIHKYDPTIQFQVISRDDRCKMLGQRIAKDNIRFVSSPNFSEVAGFLHEAEVGFLLRKDTIVNRVCFPTKLGEYLASGSWVVSSDIDWDVKDWFEKNKIGLLVHPNMNSFEIASLILSHRSNLISDQIKKDVLKVSIKMNRAYWVNNLKIKIFNNEN